ncbi:adenosine deaminase-like protein isoform X2 [Neocloeon triangulifer]|uniref:adenosine deaminase-like protein isoform X2 n=1 Tax=Neocloeon triangulifer TaxID=2078957 RepID=UPI00286F6683|nr:adenosine deaminase-like protein isoform X2 [Neocloeon triangulifer]
MEDFCRECPKIELHAHLNGSLSERTIQKLSHLEGAPHLYDEWQVAINHGQHRTLAECFEMFKAVHALTVTPEAVRLATSDVITDFEKDGVIYLELRSTPREVKGRMNKEQYVDAIIDAILSHQGSIVVRLLLSVDRRQGPAEAEHTLKIALDARKKHPELVVGLDLSGDPTAGALDLFLPTLSKARDQGLGVVVHCGEVPNNPEVMEMLRFAPDRLGHVTCLHPELGGCQQQWDALLASKIPVEVCLTSNLRCKTVPTYEKHHLRHLLSAGHPVALAVRNRLWR